MGTLLKSTEKVKRMVEAAGSLDSSLNQFSPRFPAILQVAGPVCKIQFNPGAKEKTRLPKPGDGTLERTLCTLLGTMSLV